jgi:serine/threonine-protein kinase
MDIGWLQKQFPDLSNFAPLAPSGQKEVFAAEHKAEGLVVLKIFKPGANAERIEREMQAPLKVKSPRVPKVAELGRMKSPTGEIVWLREKKIVGQSLKELLRAKGKLDVPTTVRIGLHVIEVLADGEKADVVHRDIKPGNIIVASDGSAWVIDFGLARHLDQESVTPTGDKFAPCTPGYAPVEQFTNQKPEVDARADLFAAGVTLFECIEGYNFFTKGAKNPREALDRVQKLKMPRIATAGVPGDFVDLVEAMTRTKAEHRPATAADALVWIKEIAAAQGVA